MSNSTVVVFGQNLVVLETSIAERYAQAIREGLWQCTVTNEPWKKGKKHGKHVCDGDCCDTRTDDEIEVCLIYQDASNPG